MFGKRERPVLFQNNDALAELLIGSGCGVIRLGEPRKREVIEQRVGVLGTRDIVYGVKKQFPGEKKVKLFSVWIVASIVGNRTSGASLSSSLPNFS